MKKAIFTLFFLIFISINSFAQGKGQKKYLPKQFQDVYFGMTLSNFMKVRNVELMKRDTTMGFRTEYTQENFDGEVYEVTYYFTNGNNGILYAMFIDFEYDYDLDPVVEKLFGSALGEEEFTIECGEKFKLKAWSFEKRLVILAKIKGTEYDE